MPASGIVLAGGDSSRFGRDKRFLETGGETLLSRTIRILRSQVDEVVVVGAQAPVGTPGIRSVSDRYPGAGPMGGLVTGLEMVSADQAFIAACDMPLLHARAIHLLLAIAQRSDVDAVVPLGHGRRHPLHAVYRRSVAEIWRRRVHFRQTPDLSLRAGLDELRVLYVQDEELRSVDPHLESLINVNTPRSGSGSGRIARKQWEGGDMASLSYHKLVRDLVPSIIRREGLSAETRLLGREEFAGALRQKLLEEATEAAAAVARDDLTVELADVLEVLRAIASEAGITVADIERVRLERLATRGGFSNRVLLIETRSDGHGATG